MNLKELFESQMLNEETKTVLQEAFDNAVQAKGVELEEGYVQKLDEAREEITQEAFDLIESTVKGQLDELAEEVAQARTLDVRYAQRLNEFKETYAEKQDELVKSMVEEQVGEEIAELKEDIEHARKAKFVGNMFEAFREAYEANFVVEGEGENLRDRLQEAEAKLEAHERETALNGLLEGLTGSKREVAMTLLENTATDKLEARFESLKPILLGESAAPTEEAPLEEGAGGKGGTGGTVVIEEEEASASTEGNQLTEAQKARNERLSRAFRNAGLK